MVGGGFRLLHLVRPFLPFIPEVHQLPHYGIHSITVVDPFYWMRTILASSRGTIMELGITPIVTSGLIIQLFVGYNLIQVDNNVREDRVLWNGAQKLLGILIIIGQAVLYVLSGMYGSVDKLGVGNAFLIILQLCFGGIIVICLDELLQKGYAQPQSTLGEELNSKVPLLHLLITRANKFLALREAFYRQDLPKVTNILAKVLIFFIVIYFQGFHVILPVRSKNARGQHGTSRTFLSCHSLGTL
ncbi:hypothetical protein ACFE04_001999 [Oxalis oulophora]